MLSYKHVRAISEGLKMQAKQIVKELRKGAKVTFCYKTLAGTVGILEFFRNNGYLIMINGMIGQAGNGETVINQTSEIIPINYAEILVYNVMFSTEVINRSVSISY